MAPPRKSERPAPSPLDRALRLLGARQRTELELDRALARAQVPPAERAAALARLRELGYMDDREVARVRARSLVGKGNSPSLAARKLRQQGVAAEDAQSAASEAADGAGELVLARRALSQRLRGRAPRDEKERQRVFRALVARGHRPSAVARALDIEWEGEDGVAIDEDL